MKRIFLLLLVACSVLAMSAQIKVVGHRGARHNTPDTPATPYYENTISSLRFAQSLGLYAAEFDVNLTADDHVVVFHGPAVPGSKKKIQQMTFAEARAIVLPGGHQIPTLEEYLLEAKKHPEVKVIMEIKPHANKERETLAVEKSMAIVKQLNMESQLEYTTFSEWMCKEIHRVDAKAKVLFLMAGLNAHSAQYCHEQKYDGMSYDINAFMNNPQLVRDAQKYGIETTMWIVNDYELADWAIRHGVTFITSDHPERIKAYVDALKPFQKR